MAMMSTDIYNAMAIELSENGMTHIAGLTYNGRGTVVDFGNPNEEELCEWRGENGEMQYAYQECWELLYVTVFIDKFHRRTHASSDEWQGWVWYKDFWAGSWSAIPEVFQLFGATAGLYHNAQFRVDVIKWTSLDGWQYEDLL